MDIKKRSFKFSIKLLEYCFKIYHLKKYEVIIKQVMRSGTIIGANIIEAYAASSKKDFRNYYRIALKSANETNYWLLLLKYFLKNKDVETLLDEVGQISKIIAKSVINLND